MISLVPPDFFDTKVTVKITFLQGEEIVSSPTQTAGKELNLSIEVSS